MAPRVLQGVPVLYLDVPDVFEGFQRFLLWYQSTVRPFGLPMRDSEDDMGVPRIFELGSKVLYGVLLGDIQGFLVPAVCSRTRILGVLRVLQGISGTFDRVFWVLCGDQGFSGSLSWFQGSLGENQGSFGLY